MSSVIAQPTAWPAWTIQAIDGADDDEGTLYVLYDHLGEIREAAAWPQPLEALVPEGYAIQRARYVSAVESDCDL